MRELREYVRVRVVKTINAETAEHDTSGQDESPALTLQVSGPALSQSYGAREEGRAAIA